MPTRRRAREVVLQLLYEDDLNQDQNQEVAEKFLFKRMHGNKPLIQFAKSLWKNVVRGRQELDKMLSARATNWSLRRMAAIDRNVLRLAAYEITKTDTPGRVVINEAVELAKRYGDRQSGQFVNGILDQLLRDGDAELTTAGERQLASATKKTSDLQESVASDTNYRAI